MDENEKEARLRQASERLYGDTRLREGLTDEQAEQLLAWGFGQVEREVERTLTLTAEEATPSIEAHLDAVRSTLQLVSQMAEQLPEAGQARSRGYVGQLVDALCEVDARTVQINDMRALEKLVERRDTLAPAQIFQQLLEIIRTPAGEEADRRVAEGGEQETGSGEPEAGGALAMATTALTVTPTNTREEEE